MNILENKMNEKIENVITLAERDGNKKRPYLLLNKLQAKYNPIKAYKALDMFDDLALQLPKIEGNIIVIGFAETATAIGARVAYQLAKHQNTNVTFLTTTREKYKQNPIVEFKEEHSHAVEQILYGEEETFTSADYIVFAEDEVTTGNTICNCVKKLNLNCKYLVASLLNCMSDDELQRFKTFNISAYWLIKTDKEGFENIGNNESINTIYKEQLNNNFNVIKYLFKSINPRLGTSIIEYHNECKELANKLKENIHRTERVLVLGTEECMYPSIVVANELDIQDYSIFVAATTRVPACTNKNIDYPLQNRYKIKSLYGDRDTYIYNLEKYDKVIVISDGTFAQKSLADALYSVGIKNITYVFI